MSFTKEFSREFVERSLWFIAKTILHKGTKTTMPRSGGVIAKAKVGGIEVMVSFENKDQQRGDLYVVSGEHGFEAIGFIEKVDHSEGTVEFRDIEFQGKKKRFRDWVLMYKLGYDEDAPLEGPRIE